MKYFRFFLFFAGMLFLAWCGNKNKLEIRNATLSRTPHLSVEMQMISPASWAQDLIYQEADDRSDGLDTLVIASDYSESSNLAAYVQKAINQLKLQNYQLSEEKTKKITLQKKADIIPGILKTYYLKDTSKGFYVAQLFFEKGKDVIMLSYASDTPKHTKTFTKELSSLQLTF